MHCCTLGPIKLMLHFLWHNFSQSADCLQQEWFTRLGLVANVISNLCL
jgi:hypothetical protein